jgi:hypothetical protein
MLHAGLPVLGCIQTVNEDNSREPAKRGDISNVRLAARYSMSVDWVGVAGLVVGIAGIGYGVFSDVKRKGPAPVGAHGARQP